MVLRFQVDDLAKAFSAVDEALKTAESGLDLVRTLPSAARMPRKVALAIILTQLSQQLVPVVLSIGANTGTARSHLQRTKPTHRWLWRSYLSLACPMLSERIMKVVWC